MRVPFSVQGALFVPAFTGVLFAFRFFCQSDPLGQCLTDPLIEPVFLPAIALNGILGVGVGSYELVFIFLYWALVGFLLGFIFDLHRDQSLY